MSAYGLEFTQLRKNFGLSKIGFPQDTNAITINEEALAALTLRNIEKTLPVHNKDLYLSKIYFLFTKVLSEPGSQREQFAVRKEIDRRIRATQSQIEEFENNRMMSRLGASFEMVIEGFYLYYEGLLCFKDYLTIFDENLVLDAFELIFRGDVCILDAERDMDEERSRRDFEAVA